MDKDKNNQNTSIEVYSPDISNGYKAYFGNVLISSSRDLTIIEERYLTLLIAKAAEQLSKYEHLSGVRFEPDDVLCPKYIRFSPKELLLNSKNYDKARKDAEEMAGKTITFETEDDYGDKITRIVHLTGPVDIKCRDENSKRKDPYILLRIEPELWKLILDMSKGFSAIDIKYMFRLKKPASMRLLPLFFNLTKNPVDKRYIPPYSIDKLRKMFGKENEYRDTAAFISRVIDPALEEIKSLDAPFYGEKRLIKDSRGKIEKLQFVPRINLSKFEVAFPCLLPDSPVFRSKSLAKVFAFKYAWEKIPKQVANIIDFAQEYIENDAELCNVVADIQPYTRNSDVGEIGGFVSLMKTYLRRHYNVEYVAPSKGGTVYPSRREGECYTDWQLLKYPYLSLNAYEDLRQKALLEAQKKHYTEDFMKIKTMADELMKEMQVQSVDNVKLIYGTEHLTDLQIFENVKAGIIDDRNVEKYDEESYNRLSFIVSLMLECNMNGLDFTWELTQERLAADYYHHSPAPSLSAASASDDGDDYNLYNIIEAIDKVWDGTLPVNYLDKVPEWYRNHYGEQIETAVKMMKENDYKDSTELFESVMKNLYGDNVFHHNEIIENNTKTLFEDLSN